MAIQAAVVDRNVSLDGSVINVSWATLANGDTGAPVQFSAWSDKSYQVFGTFGAGGNLVMEGSNDGTTFTAIANRQGTTMNFTAASMNTSQDRPIWIRPRVSAGDGTTLLTCYAACHRSDLPVGGGAA